MRRTLWQRASWYVLGALGLAILVTGFLVQPAITAVALMAVALAVAFVAVPRNLVIGFSIAAALVALALAPAGTLSFPYGNTIPGAMVTLLLIVAAARRLGTMRAPALWPLLVTYTAIVLLGSISASVDPFYVILAIFSVVMYAVGCSTNVRERRIVTVTVIALAGVEAVLGIVEALSKRGPLLGQAITIDATNPFIPSLHRSQGTLGHPLVLSMLLLTGLALVLLRGTVAARMRYPLAALLIVGIVFTGSTSAILAGAALVLYWLFVRRSIGGTVISVLLGIGGVIFVIATWGRQIAAYLGDALFGSDATHRLGSISAIPKLITDRSPLNSLFGGGLGSVQSLYQQNILVDDGFGAIDDQFVTSLVQAGLIGTACLLAFFILVFVRGGRSTVGLMLVFVLMCFSFDALTWYVSAGVMFALCAIAMSARDDAVAANARAAATESSGAAIGPRLVMSGDGVRARYRTARSALWDSRPTFGSRSGVVGA
jgi:hypothetical protein